MFPFLTFCFIPLSCGLLAWFTGSALTTGMIVAIPGTGTVIIPVESLLVLDLQYGGVVVQYGQDDFVHVLSQTKVDFFLLLQGFH